MNQAIKIAIENGYKGTTIPLEKMPDGSILIDHLFWQALAKSLSFGGECGFTKCPAEGQHKQCWMKVWHKFIDHQAEGKDIESFFANLLNSLQKRT